MTIKISGDVSVYNDELKIRLNTEVKERIFFAAKNWKRLENNKYVEFKCCNDFVNYVLDNVSQFSSVEWQIFIRWVNK